MTMICFLSNIFNLFLMTWITEETLIFKRKSFVFNPFNSICLNPYAIFSICTHEISNRPIINSHLWGSSRNLHDLLSYLGSAAAVSRMQSRSDGSNEHPHGLWIPQLSATPKSCINQRLKFSKSGWSSVLAHPGAVLGADVSPLHSLLSMKD